VFDIGANVGWHTIRLSKCVGEGGRVVSFEPSPHDRELLELNIAANELQNVMVDSRAVAEHSCVVRFLIFGSPGVHHVQREDSPTDGAAIEVRAISLDELIYEHGVPAPTFMKIDVEGGEVEVLRGAQRLLREARPTIVVEARHNVTVEPIAQMALEFGYSVTELSDSETCDLLLVPAGSG
jgi:FkbM family methyltransferase